jgi:putative ABC transport system permease protein
VRQVRSGLMAAQVLSALPGAIIGVPLGLVAYGATVVGGSPPPALWLVATVAGTLLAMAALTVIPARLASRQPIAEALQSEAA